jgi:hypothetical protein
MFKPGKMVTHSNKSHYAEGGLVDDRGRRLAEKGGRLSDNVEDRRSERPGWNRRALNAIDGTDDREAISYSPGTEVPGSRPGVNGKTPDNLGVDDSFTRTYQYKEKARNELMNGPKSDRESDSTTTPGGPDEDAADYNPSRTATPRSR